MKKRVKKLHFKRETLRNLQGRELKLPAGGNSFQQTVPPEEHCASAQDPTCPEACDPIGTQAQTACINTVPLC